MQGYIEKVYFCALFETRKQTNKHNDMKFYDIDSVFAFGKYEGQTIAEVYEKDPKYLKYCEENIDEFYVSPSVMRELKSMNRSINDSALLDVNFDKMSDDEVDAFLKNLEEEDEFDDSKLEHDFDWENNDFADDSPFDEFEDEYDEEDFIDEFGDSFDENLDGGYDDQY